MKVWDAIKLAMTENIYFEDDEEGKLYYSKEYKKVICTEPIDERDWIACYQEKTFEFILMSNNYVRVEHNYIKELIKHGRTVKDIDDITLQKLKEMYGGEFIELDDMLNLVSSCFSSSKLREIINLGKWYQIHHIW